jgi:hypothetical protein
MAWGTITSLSNKVEEFGSIEIVTSHKLANEIAKSESKLKASLDNQVKEIAHAKAASVEAQIADLKTTLLQSVKVIQTRISQEHGKISSLEPFMETMRAEAFHHSNPLQSTSKLEEKIKVVEEKLADNSRFKKLEEKLNALYAKADELAIRFAELGFRGQAEANVLGYRYIFRPTTSVGSWIHTLSWSIFIMQ